MNIFTLCIKIQVVFKVIYRTRGESTNGNKCKLFLTVKRRQREGNISAASNHCKKKTQKHVHALTYMGTCVPKCKKYVPSATERTVVVVFQGRGTPWIRRNLLTKSSPFGGRMWVYVPSPQGNKQFSGGFLAGKFERVKEPVPMLLFSSKNQPCWLHLQPPPKFK